MMKPPRKPSRGPKKPLRKDDRTARPPRQGKDDRRPGPPRQGKDDRPPRPRTDDRSGRPPRPAREERAARPARPQREERPRPPRPRKDEWEPRAPRAKSEAPPPRAQSHRQPPKPLFPKEPRRRESEREDVKQVWKPGTMLYPVPAALISSLGRDGKPNVCTVAWTGTVCSDPPMLSISLRPSRLSHENIMQTRQFVVNIPSEALIRKTDYCGVVSGREVDKFAVTGMTIQPGSKVQAPVIEECPLNLECVVRKTLELGTHTMFIAEIVAVQVNKDLFTPAGRLAIEKAGLFAYVHGGYYPLGKRLGKFGYSVKKKK